ncbi:MAG: (2Fe-2S)-binding protein [Nocardioidaceae bacterium]
MSATGADTFLLDGRPVPFVPGQSVGAALTVAGVRSWRSTRVGGRPRGLFCGIGVCFDCLVVVDGTPNERACLREAAPGMRVDTQEGTGHGDLGV